MNKLSNKIIIAVLIVLAAGVTAFAAYEYRLSTKYKEKLEATYQKSFTELADYIGNINVALNKALVTSTAGKLAELSEELWSETALAKSALGQLPVSNTQLDNTSNFITQVSDYVRSVTRKLSNGGSITDEERKQISELIKYSDSLNDSLKNMESDFLNDDMELSDGKTKAVFSKSDVKNINESLKSVEKSFEDYPTLIYDGPFSEHILNKTPEALKEPEVSKEKAQKTAEDFAGKSLKYVSESAGTIPSFIFSDESNAVCVEVSKNGGHVVMMTDGCDVKNPTIDEAGAAVYAQDFLNSHGYANFKQTGFITEGNIVNFAFANTVGEYTIYSELIKIKVSMHDGKICGFEANGYLCNKTVRTIPAVLYSSDDVKNKIAKNVSVEKINLACIPKDNGREVWCYEVKGKCGGKIFLIYFNTQTLAEEEILMLVEDGYENLTI